MPSALLRRAWGEFLEQFLHALIQVLDILVGVVGERVARGASPYELLRLGVEQIDDQRPHLICFRCGCCVSKTSPSKSSPTSKSIGDVSAITADGGCMDSDNRLKGDHRMIAAFYAGRRSLFEREMPSFCMRK